MSRSPLQLPLLFNLNGQFFSPEEVHSQALARIHPLDRSYLYGDSLYEVCRSYSQQLYATREHVERLCRSAELAYFPKLDSEKWVLEMKRTASEFLKRYSKELPPHSELYVRLVLSRGTTKIGFSRSAVTEPLTYTVIAQPLAEPDAEKLKEGYHLAIAERKRLPRNVLDPAVKSGNYLNSLLAFIEEVDLQKNPGTHPVEDAILCNQHGHVTEGSTFNVGYFKRGIFVTPPCEIGILHGITRKKMIDLAHDLGIEVREVRFPPERMFEADEVFLLSTIKEIFPITRLNSKKVGGGVPGPLTLKMRAEFRKRALQEIESEKS